MTGVSYATSAEMAGELGPFPNYKANAKHMLRVIRNHRRAAHGVSEGYEGLAVNPVPLDHASCPDQRSRRPRQVAPGTARWNSARSTATATRSPPSSRPPARSAS